MKKDQNEAASQGFAPGEVAPSTASRMIAPLDIQQKEFRVARFGGYKMRDVDEFLDQVTDAMTAVIAENDRLRKGSGSGALPVVGNPDLADVNRQADEMIQRARDEAARILAEARERAAASAGPGAALAGGAAVSAFLAREKEFLQSLAGLVQGHAEQVKTMAKSARAAATPAAPRADDSSTQPVEERTKGESARGSAPAEATPPDESDVSVRSDEPVHVEEPEPARAGRSDTDDPNASDDSLRELFWGED
jgi:DivIVA domain-containing protein